MSPHDSIIPALQALDDCEEALRDLDAACCDPGRSPRMQALGETLRHARTGIDALHDDAGAVQAATEHLEAARAQVRALQAECCEPNRLPMYRTILEGLAIARVAADPADGIAS